ncbi:hypothetical protein CPC08DRAFT_766685 [Agrocybe pediades]|nr:hypothetical protein CPC08DRAFT_766685 [Agrocybe pediades]
MSAGLGATTREMFGLLGTHQKFEISRLNNGSIVYKLSMESRPAAVAAWIKRACAPNWRPEIQDLQAYEKEFKVWWKGLLDNEDGLAKPGVNGLLSVLAALLFWGDKAVRSVSKESHAR